MKDQRVAASGRSNDRIVAGDSRLPAVRRRQSFGCLRTDGVFLIGGNGDGRQDADDRDYYGGCYQGETLL